MLCSSAYFFTYQPFWKTGIMKEEQLLADEKGEIIGKVCQFQVTEDLFCVPGIGLSGIVFPCGEDEGKTAYCYGPVQKLEYQPMYGVHSFYAVRFLPGAFGRYFRIPNSEVPSSGVPLSDLIPELAPFIQQAAISKNLKQFYLVVQRMLKYLSIGGRSNNISSELVWLLSQNLLAYRGNIAIQDLADDTGFCRRHLRDIFLMNVGVSPKQLCNQIRFQYTLQDIASSVNTDMKLIDISLRNGYFDQPHFNREFRRYTGMCPSQFIDSINDHEPIS